MPRLVQSFGAALLAVLACAAAGCASAATAIPLEAVGPRVAPGPEKSFACPAGAAGCNVALFEGGKNHDAPRF